MATSMNVSLPESLKEYVRQRAEEGDFASPSEYIRCLIREDKERRARERLEGLLLEGLSSGQPREVDDAYWQDKEKRLRTAP